MSTVVQPVVRPGLDPEVRDVLRKAKERIAQGWCQFTISDNNGAVCLAGAVFGGPVDSRFRTGLLGSDLNPSFAESRAYLALADVLGFDDWQPVAIDWNDEPGRTQADVIDLLDRALAGETA